MAPSSATPADAASLEQAKLRGAVRTDFILSAEIIVIALGTVADRPWSTRIGVLVAISVLMTVGVYGLVAGIVKLDDAGLALVRRGGRGAALGRALIAGAPWLMKGLSVAGTVAMFSVGGPIVVHGLPRLETQLRALSGPPALVDALVGVAVGLLLLPVVALGTRALHRVRGT